MSETTPFGALFLSVGASKCGTTWLYSVLVNHPELHFTPEKELHYFHYKYGNPSILNDERRMQNAKTRVFGRIDPKRSNIHQIRRNLRFADAYLDSPITDEWYARLFRGKRPGSYSCDFSNFNALLPEEAWPDIAAKCSRLKVLYTMRDPLARLWSHIKFHLTMVNQTQALETWGPQDFLAFAKKPFIWDNCEYGVVLRRMRKTLGPEMLHVQFHEDMIAQTGATLTALEGFLGVAPCNYPVERINRQVNTSLNHPMPDFFPDLFRADLTRIRQEVEDLGYTIPSRWRASLCP